MIKHSSVAKIGGVDGSRDWQTLAGSASKRSRRTLRKSATGHAGEFQQALHGAVLSQGAVEHGKDDVHLPCGNLDRGAQAQIDLHLARRATFKC